MPRWRWWLIGMLVLAVAIAAGYFPVLKRNLRLSAQAPAKSEEQVRRELTQPAAANAGEPVGKIWRKNDGAFLTNDARWVTRGLPRAANIKLGRTEARPSVYRQVWRTLTRAQAPEAAAGAEAAAPGTYPSPGLPNRPGTSASPGAAEEVAEAEVAAAEVAAAGRHRSCKSGWRAANATAICRAALRWIPRSDGIWC